MDIVYVYIIKCTSRRKQELEINLPARVQTRLLCWSKVDMHSDVLMFHNFRRPSPPAVINCIPRDRNSALRTEDSCPSNVYVQRPSYYDNS